MNEPQLARIVNTLEQIAARLEAQEASRYTCRHPGCTAAKSSQWATCPQHRRANGKPADVLSDQ